MYYHRIIKIISILFFFSLLFSQTTIIKGKLLGHDNKPSEFATISIGTLSQVYFNNFHHTDKNGNYKIVIDKPGNYKIMFAMPNHKAEKLIVINDKSQELVIDVNLATYKFKDFDEVYTAGSFNNNNIKAPEKMKKSENGLYIFEFDTKLKKVEYQLCSITANDRTINSPVSKEFVPDSTGDFRSVIYPENGKIKIIFNPNDLIKSNKKFRYELSGNKTLANLNKQLLYIKSELELLKDEFFDFLKKNKTVKGFQPSHAEFFENLPALIEKEKNNSDLYKCAYLSAASYMTGKVDFKKAEEYFNSLEPTNIVWSILPNAFMIYRNIFPRYKHSEIMEKFAAQTNSLDIIYFILINKAANAFYSKNTEELKKLSNLIKEKYADNKKIYGIIKQFPSEIKILLGKEIPDFKVKSIDDPNVTISKEKMMGKIYLLDFWATWCGPCVNEMESLHKAYEKFKQKGFEIISLSIDRNVDVIKKFRSLKWNMPWKNGFINNSDGLKIKKDFEVIGIPKPILVGKDGKILALDSNLRGEELEKTLEKYFK